MLPILSTPLLFPTTLRGSASERRGTNIITRRGQISLKAHVFVSLLNWSSQVKVNTITIGKDISNDLREAAVVPHQSGKWSSNHHQASWSSTFSNVKHYSHVESIQDSCQSEHPSKCTSGVRPSNAQANTQQPRATSQASTGLNGHVGC